MKFPPQARNCDALTLVEMVGVVAVIGVLAGIAAPRISAEINDGRYSRSVASINRVKTATLEYFDKRGSFPLGNQFDAELVNAKLLEQPLACPVAASASVSVMPVAATAPTGHGAAYSLDGTYTIAGEQVVECRLAGVRIEDARELSRWIDGEPARKLTNPDRSVAGDFKGRVTYAVAPVGCTTDVYIYIAHR